MAQIALQTGISFRDYLAFEEARTTKHEWYDGRIYAMPGGSPEHAAWAIAVAVAC